MKSYVREVSLRRHHNSVILVHLSRSRSTRNRCRFNPLWVKTRSGRTSSQPCHRSHKFYGLQWKNSSHNAMAHGMFDWRLLGIVCDSIAHDSCQLFFRSLVPFLTMALHSIGSYSIRYIVTVMASYSVHNFTISLFIRLSRRVFLP